MLSRTNIKVSRNLRRTFRCVVPLCFGMLTIQAQTDPGPRGGVAGAGGVIAGLTVKEGKFFDDGKDRFAEAETVAEGLGPRFNLDSCQGCHAHPASGGSSPALNPQVNTTNVAPRTQVDAVTSLGLISAIGPV